MDKAIYLFAFARTGRLPELDATGLDDKAPLLTHDEADVTAVYSFVSLDDFSGPAAEANLNDLGWVGPRVVKHGEIVRGAMNYSPVLPARFGTLFSCKESLQRVMQHNHSGIVEFFDHVEGREEWAVKVLLSKTAARDTRFAEQLAARSKDLEAMSQGMRYVKERQLRAEIDKDMTAWLKGVLAALAAQLTACAIDCCKREISAGASSEPEAQQVAKWAFLVDGSETENFESIIARANAGLHANGLSFDLTGPWPPYSFTPHLDTEAR